MSVGSRRILGRSGLEPLVGEPLTEVGEGGLRRSGQLGEQWGEVAEFHRVLADRGRHPHDERGHLGYRGVPGEAGCGLGPLAALILDLVGLVEDHHVPVHEGGPFGGDLLVLGAGPLGGGRRLRHRQQALGAVVVDHRDPQSAVSDGRDGGAPVRNDALRAHDQHVADRPDLRQQQHTAPGGDGLAEADVVSLDEAPVAGVGRLGDALGRLDLVGAWLHPGDSAGHRRDTAVAVVLDPPLPRVVRGRVRGQTKRQAPADEDGLAAAGIPSGPVRGGDTALLERYGENEHPLPRAGPDRCRHRLGCGLRGCGSACRGTSRGHEWGIGHFKVLAQRPDAHIRTVELQGSVRYRRRQQGRAKGSMPTARLAQ